MRILAVETSGARGGIALADGENLLSEVRLGEGLRHGRDLILAAKAACREAGWPPRAIDLVAVSIGPGSFTGIRIAVVLAKFLAWDAGTQVVAVPSLRALAENAPADRLRVVPIVDAKRGGLFAGIFERRDTPAPGDPGARRGLVRRGPGEGGSGGSLSEFDEIFGPALIEPEDLAKRLEPPAFILGHGITKGRAALSPFDLAPEELWDVRPGVVARLGYELAASGRFADPLLLEPIYIRPPEAQEIWDRRHGRRA